MKIFAKSLLILLSTFIFSANAALVILQVKTKKIIVNGKEAVVYTIEQPDGTWGYYGVRGKDFDVIVENKTNVPTGIHWHGLILPNNQDGVPGVTQKAIMPGHSYRYHFKLLQAGTFWMHSHYGLQIQKQMEAPLIIENHEDPYKNLQQVVVMFQDFTFKNPDAILQNLQSAKSNMQMSMMKNKSMQSDLNDIHYDAFLTNYHTPDNPQRVLVKPNSKIRLRFINGSASSNFWVNLGNLSGQAISFDGADIQPISGSKFQLAVGQRIDILVNIPQQGSVFPILGQLEGSKQQTGIILQTLQTAAKINSQALSVSPPLNNDQEFSMKSLHPFTYKPIAQTIPLNLSGSMQPYRWTINNQAWPHVIPITIKPNTRIEFIFNNQSNMAHPMHLHGHVFELVSINNRIITDGPLHDTILVLPHTQVKVIFDSNYPGKWMLHCHNAYHQAAGMMTYIIY